MMSRFVVAAAGVAGVLAIWLALAAAAPTQIADTDRSQATRVADQMLNHIAVPAGATQISAAPKSSSNFLDGPFSRYLVTSQVDRSRLWTVRGSLKTAVAFMEAHLPNGAKPTGATSGSTVLQNSFSLKTVNPRTLGARQLVFSGLVLPSGTTVIRADAEIRYFAPRPADERIPTTGRLLNITVAGNPAHPSLSLTVRNQAEVARIAHVADSLPFVGNDQGASYNCPDFGTDAPVDRFVFRRSANGPVLASISELASQPISDVPCTSATLNIGGHREPALQDGGLLIKAAGALLHIRLSR
jgi:hypothetical protein